MEPAESRLPLDDVRVRAALAARGWTGPQPQLHGRVGCIPGLASGMQTARSGSSAVAEAVDDGLGTMPSLPSGAGLWVSTVADVGDVATSRHGWLPLVAALATADALRDASRVPAEVLWPDGLTVPGAMCGGDAGTRSIGAVDVVVTDGRALLSVAIVVSMSMVELPRRTTSLYADGGRIDRAEILAALLPAIGRRLEQWRDDDPALRADYRDRCQTMGRLVEVDGLEGRVSGVDDDGRLTVKVGAELRAVDRHAPAPVLL